MMKKNSLIICSLKYVKFSKFMITLDMKGNGLKISMLYKEKGKKFMLMELFMKGGIEITS